MGGVASSIRATASGSNGGSKGEDMIINKNSKCEEEVTTNETGRHGQIKRNERDPTANKEEEEGHLNKKPRPANDTIACQVAKQDGNIDGGGDGVTTPTTTSHHELEQLKWPEGISFSAYSKYYNDALWSFYPFPENDQGIVEGIAHMRGHQEFHLWDIHKIDSGPTSVRQGTDLFTHIIQFDPTDRYRIFVGDGHGGDWTCIRVYNDIRNLTKDPNRPEEYIPDRIIRLPFDSLIDFRLTMDGQKMVATVYDIYLSCYMLVVLDTYDDSKDFITSQLPIHYFKRDGQNILDRPHLQETLHQRSCLKKWNLPYRRWPRPFRFIDESPKRLFTYESDFEGTKVRFLTWSDNADDSIDLPITEYHLSHRYNERVVVSPTQDKNVVACHDHGHGFTLYQDGDIKCIIEGEEGMGEAKDWGKYGAFSRNGKVYAVAYTDGELEDDRRCIKYYDVHKMLANRPHEDEKKVVQDHSKKYLLEVQKLPNEFEDASIKFLDKYTVVVGDLKIQKSFRVPKNAVIP